MYTTQQLLDYINTGHQQLYGDNLRQMVEQLPTLHNIQMNINKQCEHDWQSWTDDAKQTVAVIGLAEEAGEVAGIYKRVLRNFPKDAARTTPTCWREEMGDVLWYWMAICNQFGLDAEQIWCENIIKLEARYGKGHTKLDATK